MGQSTPLSARAKWSIVIAAVLLHPVLLCLMLPIFGEPSNFVGAAAPIVATLLFTWRIGIAATIVNVIVSAWTFSSLTTMRPAEGWPKAIFSALVIATACFGAEKLRRYIEQRRVIVEELNRAKKMEAVGRLAGGVAHDINNTLNSIMASVVAHRQELEPYGRQFQDLDNIAAACERGAQLTRNLLGFARRSRYNRQTISLNEVVECVHALLKRTANKNIRIDVRLAADRPAISADKAQIESAVMNLCINALDAMGESGILTMVTGKEGDRVFIAIKDTGVGMNSEIKEHVFEPFFTTKAEGKGTGLGLSLVYGVVHAMSGRISLDSMPGKGTSITLFFPMTTAAPSTSISQTTLRQVSNPKYLSGRTVLLIDDDPLVLRSSARMLRALGCKVVTAGRGREATAIFKARSDAVDLVIADLIMPDMDGIAAIEALHQIKPSLPVILASGYTRESDRLESIKERHAAVRFLAKPYRPEELINVTKELLQSSGNPEVLGEPKV
jgi:two-component system, cell cycle sensor histidine kinase and response regulator CckA